MISAKNLDMKYPCAHNLNLHVKSKYSEEKIIKTEGLILRILNWDLFKFSILDIVRFVRQQGVIFTSD